MLSSASATKFILYQIFTPNLQTFFLDFFLFRRVSNLIIIYLSRIEKNFFHHYSNHTFKWLKIKYSHFLVSANFHFKIIFKFHEFSVWSPHTVTKNEKSIWNVRVCITIKLAKIKLKAEIYIIYIWIPVCRIYFVQLHGFSSLYLLRALWPWVGEFGCMWDLVCGWHVA